MAVNTYPDDYDKGQLLSANDVNTIRDNGVIQVDEITDLETLPDAVKIAYVVNESTVYVVTVSGWEPLVSTPELVEYEPVVGTVQMFYGDPANVIGQGWVVCDGENGTPDLRGRVPVGVNESADDEGAGLVSLGDEIGNASHRLTALQSGLPAHDVNVTVTPEGTVNGGSVSIPYTPAGTVTNVSVTGTTKGSVRSTSATVYANYHNHYQWRTQKTVGGGSGKSVWSFSSGTGAQQANNSIYRTDGANWAIGGSTGTPSFVGSSMTSSGSGTFSGTAATIAGNVSGASFTGSTSQSTGSVAAADATESFDLAQPAIGLHFIMYKGVTTIP